MPFRGHCREVTIKLSCLCSEFPHWSHCIQESFKRLLAKIAHGAGENETHLLFFSYDFIDDISEGK